ncbi:MAG TPA: integrase core domain-containing protein [Micropepsaceae bacterium]|nr:integrase core domain-containing protein [Micropepsaceae bacterium]
MPWKETCAVDQRIRFVVEACGHERPLTELCAEYGISRKTAYKWLTRYREHRLDGLKDRSRAPLRHGLQRPAQLLETVVGLRERYPWWGPKKLRFKLGALYPDIDLPSASTIGDWLKKEGLTNKRRPRPRCTPSSHPLGRPEQPNDIWALDFKGWFKTGNDERCDPFTVSDLYSRYLLHCAHLERLDHDHVHPVMDALFCEFGLPRGIRSDNGEPFASVAAGGLSRLSLWWTKLGIELQRIQPGKPQQNGCHERMHGTLKIEAASPPAINLTEQQQRLHAFRVRFNDERPHEALAGRTPASVYQPSARPYPCPLREPEYDDNAAVRRVRTRGEIKWGGELVYVSQVLAGERVGITETATGDWVVCFGPITLGYIDPKRSRLCRKPLRTSTAPGCEFVDEPAASPTTSQPQTPSQTLAK